MTLPRRSLLLAAALAGGAGAARAQGGTSTLTALAQRANAGTVGVISGGPDGTYVRIAADLAAVLDDGDALRVLPILGKGSLQNIADILVLRGVDVGIVQSDVLAYARRERLLPGVDSLIQYVTKLYDEEVHVLARPDIARIEDLAGKPVNVDGRGSGTAMTASLVFGALGLEVAMRHDPQDAALEKLRRGEIAALVYVAGKPARLFNGIPPGSGLTLLSVPATPALLETYLPAEFSRGDYPALVPENTVVETIAVGAVMAVYAWAPATERHRKVARFVEAFTAKFPAFLQPPRHPKWREVNLSAQVPGWTRFTPAAAPARPLAAR
ncbi:TAXI family TRAP transporter solute-binding subunit [Roseicella aquatilis]|uniref:TRAP transporter substrate-binding protein n=1 Tax=Roseicella aquatilis TaxID=2527868 RepID=A0A4R4D5M0_9PROT|nr:TAXI family TRAP transporter solute-binding subunit [Roseicella aquatilis]TCZ53593.1 TRAP transporter substrate-binding protein [Roseicella aquatilis]